MQVISLQKSGLFEIGIGNEKWKVLLFVRTEIEVLFSHFIFLSGFLTHQTNTHINFRISLQCIAKCARTQTRTDRQILFSSVRCAHFDLEEKLQTGLAIRKGEFARLPFLALPEKALHVPHVKVENHFASLRSV